jgi:hypothetical protein
VRQRRETDPRRGNGHLRVASNRAGPTVQTEIKIFRRLLLVLCAGMSVLVPVSGWAQDTKPPEVKAPEVKAPETKAPDTKPAENCPRGAVANIPDSLRAVQDENDATTFYRHQSSPAGPGEEAFFLYIGKKACEVWLRIRIQFPGTRPAGNLRLRIKADDKSYDFPVRHLSQSEDPNTRGYWYDELVDPDHLLMLFKVAASSRAAVRLESAAGADEHVVSDREKQALTVVLGAYHSLGGKLAHGLGSDACVVAAAGEEPRAVLVCELRAARPPDTPLGGDTPFIFG